MSDKGYVLVTMPDQPRANKSGYIFEHHLIAEKALGKPLPNKAVVHHVNGIKDDNRPENLVICQDNAYHTHLHMRIRAVKATGNPNARPCKYCRVWDVIEPTKSGRYYHKQCANTYNRKVRARIALLTFNLSGLKGGE